MAGFWLLLRKIGAAATAAILFVSIRDDGANRTSLKIKRYVTDRHRWVRPIGQHVMLW